MHHWFWNPDAIPEENIFEWRKCWQVYYMYPPMPGTTFSPFGPDCFIDLSIAQVFRLASVGLCFLIQSHQGIFVLFYSLLGFIQRSNWYWHLPHFQNFPCAFVWFQEHIYFCLLHSLMYLLLALMPSGKCKTKQNKTAKRFCKKTLMWASNTGMSPQGGRT